MRLAPVSSCTCCPTASATASWPRATVVRGSNASAPSSPRDRATTRTTVRAAIRAKSRPRLPPPATTPRRRMAPGPPVPSAAASCAASGASNPSPPIRFVAQETIAQAQSLPWHHRKNSVQWSERNRSIAPAGGDSAMADVSKEFRAPSTSGTIADRAFARPLSDGDGPVRPSGRPLPLELDRPSR
jgi:hypothetical protein